MHLPWELLTPMIYARNAGGSGGGAGGGRGDVKAGARVTKETQVRRETRCGCAPAALRTVYVGNPTVMRELSVLACRAWVGTGGGA